MDHIGDGRQGEMIGPYQVIRGLGAGGMGEVLLARDPRLGREVAIKRIRSEKSDACLRARFRREARLAAGFNHPALVQVYDVLEDGGAEHLVMEYVAGRSLRDLLDERGALPPSETLPIARSVAEGLAYAHERGVVHRDLKTENVLTPRGLASIVVGAPRDSEAEEELGAWVELYLDKKVRSFESEVDPDQLDEAGWGVIFAASDPRAAEIRDALGPLLERRAEQAREKYRVYFGDDGFRDGDSKLDFLARHGAGPGPVDPANVPYFLLLIGSPTRIPYRFQYLLDLQYAVGRIDFETVEEYRAYAEGVVAAERDGALGRRATFFAVRNPGDDSTRLSHDRLVGSLLEELPPELPDWTFETHRAVAATKARLKEILGRGEQERPAVLVSTSHGMEYPATDGRQRARQGAILCQDWSGEGRSDSSMYFTGEDAAQSRVVGMVALLLELARRVVLLLHYGRVVDVTGAGGVDVAGADGGYGLIGRSAIMDEVRGAISRVAPLDVPVLLRGETGTGKELVARALHEHSRGISTRPSTVRSSSTSSATLRWRSRRCCFGPSRRARWCPWGASRHGRWTCG